jgi:hypothetical protein
LGFPICVAHSCASSVCHLVLEGSACPIRLSL